MLTAVLATTFAVTTTKIKPPSPPGARIQKGEATAYKSAKFSLHDS
jgi:hypothetical protein